MQFSGDEKARSSRRAAGQDPLKRNQILDGAKRCFLSLGFDDASIIEMSSEAGFS